MGCLEVGSAGGWFQSANQPPKLGLLIWVCGAYQPPGGMVLRGLLIWIKGMMAPETNYFANVTKRFHKHGSLFDDCARTRVKIHKLLLFAIAARNHNTKPILKKLHQRNQLPNLFCFSRPRPYLLFGQLPKKRLRSFSFFDQLKKNCSMRSK